MARLALSNLTVDDIRSNPVWEMVELPSHQGDVYVKPVMKVPVKSMRNRLIGTEVQLADGTTAWALLGNLSLNNPTATKHFLTISVHNHGKWFDLARYHDVDVKHRNADAMARFLGKKPSDIFPIRYDVKDLAVGLPGVVQGQIDSAPQTRLTDEELVRLSLADD